MILLNKKRVEGKLAFSFLLHSSFRPSFLPSS
jgi:hypothetical protein